MTKPKKPSEPRYDPKELTEAAVNLYHFVTGQEADEAMKARLGAGVEGFMSLYQQDPRLAYGVAQALSPMADKHLGEHLGLPGKGDYGPRALKDIAYLFGDTGEPKE